MRQQMNESDIIIDMEPLMMAQAQKKNAKNELTETKRIQRIIWKIAIITLAVIALFIGRNNYYNQSNEMQRKLQAADMTRAEVEKYFEVDISGFEEALKKEFGYTTVEYLAAGAFGMVFKVTTKGGDKIAVKAMWQETYDKYESARGTEYHKKAYDEFDDFVIRLCDIKKATFDGKDESKDWVFLEMDVMEEDLYEFMRKNQEDTSGLTVANILDLRNKLMGLFIYFSKDGIVYNDLKTDNLLITKQGGSIETIKLTDFDMTMKWKEDKYQGKTWIEKPFYSGTQQTSPYITHPDAYDVEDDVYVKYHEMAKFVRRVVGADVWESIDYANLGNLMTCFVDWKYKITNKWAELNYFQHFSDPENWKEFKRIMNSKEKGVPLEMRNMVMAFFPDSIREDNWSLNAECYKQMNWAALKERMEEDKRVENVMDVAYGTRLGKEYWEAKWKRSKDEAEAKAKAAEDTGMAREEREKSTIELPMSKLAV